MATFQVESDWHLEHSVDGAEYHTWDANFPVNADYLLLAGDCGRVNPMIRGGNNVDHGRLYEAMLTRLAKKYKQVFLISGNNEPKGRATLEESMARLLDMENRIPNLVVLNRQSCRLDSLGITIYGCTLWSHIRADAHKSSGDAGAWTGETDEAHNARYAEELESLKKGVTDVRANHPNDRIIIMTHHAPTILNSGQPKREFRGGRTARSQFSGYHNDILGGEGVEGLRNGDYWIFGHTHYSNQFTQDEVSCCSNQRGGYKNDDKLDETKYKKGQVFITV